MEAKDIVVNFKKLINYSKNHDAVETAKEITNIFSADDLIMETKDVDQAYFKSHSKTYFIKGGNGLKVEILSGNGDKFGNMITHSGISIFISSDILKTGIDYDYALFSQNHYENESAEILSLVNESVKETLEFQKVLEYFQRYDADPMIYNVLSNELRNNNEIILQVLDSINDNANFEHKDQENYADISPYGGIDINVEESAEIYLNTIDRFNIPGNEKFIENAKIYFMSNTENCRFIHDELKRFDQIIYYADHADDYRYNKSIFWDMVSLECDISEYPDKDKLLSDLEKIEDDIVINNDMRESNEEKKNELNNRLSELQEQKYNLLSYFTQRPKDNEEIININENIKSIQISIDNLLNEFIDMKEKKSLIEIDIKNLREKENLLREFEEKEIKLKYDYRYLLNDSFAEIAYDPEQFENSLQRQIEAKNSIIIKKSEYTDLLNYANRTPELYNIKKEIFISEDNNQDIKYVCGLITDNYAVYINGGDDIRIFDKSKDSFLEKEGGYNVYDNLLRDIKSDHVKPLYDQVTPYINMFKELHDVQNESEDDIEL